MEKFIKKSEAHYLINPDMAAGKKIDIFATENIIKDLSDKTIKQAIDTANTEGVKKINLNADAHEGYGCPIGSVVVTKDTVMLGPIGYDISCSMSYLQTDIPVEEVASKQLRRELIDKLTKYIPHGTGKKRAKKQIDIGNKLYKLILQHGASDNDVIDALDINSEWLKKLERTNLLADVNMLSSKALDRGDGQLGSLGSGNHFLEAQRVEIIDSDLANKWGLSNNLSILTHCGSRGIGHQIATEYFEKLWKYFNDKGWEVKDKELVYAGVDDALGERYIKSMGCAANFAIINHLIINSAICSALREVFPEADCNFIYHISHNLAQQEQVGKQTFYVHRKGATRAFPAKHPALENTVYYETGHPVLIPGSSLSGSSIMVGLEGNEINYHSTPHGSGRAMGRREARRKLSQDYVNEKMDQGDVLCNMRNYPIDEFAEAYKDYDEVIKSVMLSGLAKEVAKLKPLFVIKGN